MGYTTNRCYKRYNKGFKTPSIHHALHALMVSEFDPKDWIPHSGASFHMLGNSTLFTSLHAY